MAIIPSESKEPQAPELREIPIAKIHVPQGRRPLRDIRPLADSIAARGLLQPITVVTTEGGYQLVTGLHRLEAVKLLGWDSIPALLSTLSGPCQELAEIDENLIRTELSSLERAEALVRRKQLYEAMYPDSVRPKRGRRRKNSEPNSPFSKDAATRLNLSQRTIQQAVQIGTGLTKEVRDLLRRSTVADRHYQLLELARRVPNGDQQRAVAELLISGEAATVKSAAVMLGLTPDDSLPRKETSSALRQKPGQLDEASVIRMYLDHALQALLGSRTITAPTFNAVVARLARPHMSASSLQFQYLNSLHEAYTPMLSWRALREADAFLRRPPKFEGCHRSLLDATEDERPPAPVGAPLQFPETGGAALAQRIADCFPGHRLTSQDESEIIDLAQGDSDLLDAALLLAGYVDVTAEPRRGNSGIIAFPGLLKNYLRNPEKTLADAQERIDISPEWSFAWEVHRSYEDVEIDWVIAHYLGHFSEEHEPPRQEIQRLLDNAAGNFQHLLYAMTIAYDEWLTGNKQSDPLWLTRRRLPIRHDQLRSWAKKVLVKLDAREGDKCARAANSYRMQRNYYIEPRSSEGDDKWGEQIAAELTRKHADGSIKEIAREAAESPVD